MVTSIRFLKSQNSLIQPLYGPMSPSKGPLEANLRTPIYWIPEPRPSHSPLDACHYSQGGEPLQKPPGSSRLIKELRAYPKRTRPRLIGTIRGLLRTTGA